jgi:hypothetical protein
VARAAALVSGKTKGPAAIAADPSFRASCAIGQLAFYCGLTTSRGYPNANGHLDCPNASDRRYPSASGHHCPNASVRRCPSASAGRA